MTAIVVAWSQRRRWLQHPRGVRLLHTGLTVVHVDPMKKALADAGVPWCRTRGASISTPPRWTRCSAAAPLVDCGYGELADLERIEDDGAMSVCGPNPKCPHTRKHRLARRDGDARGSGHDYLEVQRVAKVFDTDIAAVFELREGDVVVSIHCGSRGARSPDRTRFLRCMVLAAPTYGIELPDIAELARAPITLSGWRGLSARCRQDLNCALANRQIIMHLVRRAFAGTIPP